MIRALLLAVMLFLIARAFWQVVDGIIAALGGSETRQKPRKQAVKLVRDPVCGTHVMPRSALSLTDRSGATYYFCSDRCRTQFQKKT